MEAFGAGKKIPPSELRHDTRNADALLSNQSIDDIREEKRERLAARLNEIDGMADALREKLRQQGNLNLAESKVLSKLLDERGKTVAALEGREEN